MASVDATITVTSLEYTLDGRQVGGGKGRAGCSSQQRLVAMHAQQCNKLAVAVW
jgi:hypothetical protein